MAPLASQLAAALAAHGPAVATGAMAGGRGACGSASGGTMGPPAMGSSAGGGGCGTATSGGGTMGPAMASGLATLASGGGTGSGGQMGPTAAEYTSSAGRKRPRVEEEQADDDNCTVCAESDEGSDTASSNVTIDLQRLQADFEEEPAGNE